MSDAWIGLVGGLGGAIVGGGISVIGGTVLPQQREDRLRAEKAENDRQAEIVEVVLAAEDAALRWDPRWHVTKETKIRAEFARHLHRLEALLPEEQQPVVDALMVLFGVVTDRKPNFDVQASTIAVIINAWVRGALPPERVMSEIRKVVTIAPEWGRPLFS